MEAIGTNKQDYRPFQVGQEVTFNGVEVVITGKDMAGNPIVESRPQPVVQHESLKAKDWSDVSAGIGAVSVAATPILAR